MLSEELIQKVISGNALLYFNFVISCCAGGRVSLFNYGSVLEKIFFFIGQIFNILIVSILTLQVVKSG
jgi:hypothetical protein